MKKSALEGVKIADFSWMAMGPAAVKFAADLGAEVILIESKTRPDILRFAAPAKDGELGMNRSAIFALYQDSKLSLTLNMKVPQARAVASRIVYDWADVVVDGHVPGVMERWGLDYETIKRRRPDLIYVAASIYGQTGPYSKMPGHGAAMTQLAGFSHISGWPDGEQAIPSAAYSNFVSFPYVLVALLAALIYRKKTGKGQSIDVSQLECGVQLLAVPIMDYLINDHIMMRMGNYSTNAAPHAVYRCLGEDRWCAIAVSTDKEWQGFCKVIGNPEWTREPRFATLRGRKENEDQLNALVESWTVSHSAEEVMNLMQAAGVPAGVAARGQDLVADPQLNYRGAHVILEHPEIGRHIYQPPPYRLSKTPHELTMPAPCIGQHNEYILKSVLRMSDDEVANLVESGGLE